MAHRPRWKLENPFSGPWRYCSGCICRNNCARCQDKGSLFAKKAAYWSRDVPKRSGGGLGKVVLAARFVQPTCWPRAFLHRLQSAAAPLCFSQPATRVAGCSVCPDDAAPENGPPLWRRHRRTAGCPTAMPCTPQRACSMRERCIPSHSTSHLKSVDKGTPRDRTTNISPSCVPRKHCPDPSEQGKTGSLGPKETSIGHIIQPPA